MRQLTIELSHDSNVTTYVGSLKVLKWYEVWSY